MERTTNYQPEQEIKLKKLKCQKEKNYHYLCHCSEEKVSFTSTESGHVNWSTGCQGNIYHIRIFKPHVSTQHSTITEKQSRKDSWYRIFHYTKFNKSQFNPSSWSPIRTYISFVCTLKNITFMVLIVCQHIIYFQYLLILWHNSK